MSQVILKTLLETLVKVEIFLVHLVIQYGLLDVQLHFVFGKMIFSLFLEHKDVFCKDLLGNLYLNL